MDRSTEPEPDDREPRPAGDDEPPGSPTVQNPVPEHLARRARIVEQGLPPALRERGTGLG